MSLQAYLRERAKELRERAERDPNKKDELIRIANDLEKLAGQDTLSEDG